MIIHNDDDDDDENYFYFVIIFSIFLNTFFDCSKTKKKKKKILTACVTLDDVTHAVNIYTKELSSMQLKNKHSIFDQILVAYFVE